MLSHHPFLGWGFHFFLFGFRFAFFILLLVAFVYFDCVSFDALDPITQSPNRKK